MPRDRRWLQTMVCSYHDRWASSRTMYRVLSLACQRGRASRTNYHGNHRTVAAGYREVRPMPRDCGVQRKGTSRWTLSSARISRLGSPFRARIRLASRARLILLLQSDSIMKIEEKFAAQSPIIAHHLFVDLFFLIIDGCILIAKFYFSIRGQSKWNLSLLFSIIDLFFRLRRIYLDSIAKLHFSIRRKTELKFVSLIFNLNLRLNLTFVLISQIVIKLFDL